MRPRFPDGFLEQNLPSMTSSVRGERALGNAGWGHRPHTFDMICQLLSMWHTLFMLYFMQSWSNSMRWGPLLSPLTGEQIEAQDDEVTCPGDRLGFSLGQCNLDFNCLYWTSDITAQRLQSGLCQETSWLWLLTLSPGHFLAVWSSEIAWPLFASVSSSIKRRQECLPHGVVVRVRSAFSLKLI